MSSTAIRTSSRKGDVAGAAAMLGRPFELDGVVVAGDQRGGTLGYPTANLRLEPDLACPRYGIYAGAARGHRAAVSIGTNPHYGGSERRIEPYLLDYDGDLYGQRLVVELWERLATRRSSSPRTRSSSRSRATSRTRGPQRAGAIREADPSRTNVGRWRPERTSPDPGARACQALRRLHRRRRHRLRRPARRGVRLPRPERRGQDVDDAHDRLRLAGDRRDAAHLRARPGARRRRRSAAASASCPSRTRSTWSSRSARTSSSTRATSGSPRKELGKRADELLEFVAADRAGERPGRAALRRA